MASLCKLRFNCHQVHLMVAFGQWLMLYCPSYPIGQFPWSRLIYTSWQYAWLSFFLALPLTLYCFYFNLRVHSLKSFLFKVSWLLKIKHTLSAIFHTWATILMVFLNWCLQVFWVWQMFYIFFYSRTWLICCSLSRCFSNICNLYSEIFYFYICRLDWFKWLYLCWGKWGLESTKDIGCLLSFL